MLRFEFTAKGRRHAAGGTLVIEIEPPRKVDGFPDFECQIRFSGVVDKRSRGVGAFPLQALDLAIQVAKAVVDSYSNEWDFYVSDEGPVTFCY